MADYCDEQAMTLTELGLLKKVITHPFMAVFARE